MHTNNPLLQHLMGQGKVSEADFIAFSSQLSYDTLVIIVEPVFASVSELVASAHQLAAMAPQLFGPIAADVSFLESVAAMHRDVFARLVLSKTEPEESQEAYLRALYQVPTRLYRIIAYVERLMAQMNKPE